MRQETNVDNEIFQRDLEIIHTRENQGIIYTECKVVNIKLWDSIYPLIVSINPEVIRGGDLVYCRGYIMIVSYVHTAYQGKPSYQGYTICGNRLISPDVSKILCTWGLLRKVKLPLEGKQVLLALKRKIGNNYELYLDESGNIKFLE